jgi:UDP-glucose 4-epimerase
MVVADIADDTVVRAVLADGVDAVLHFAARSLVGESETAPERYFGNNVGGSLALLESMRAADVRRLVFSSTCAVYGEPVVPGPLDETNPYRPQSAYGASKIAADLMISAFTRAHRFAAVSLRYFNAAGAYGHYGERHTTETHLLPLALRTLTEPDRVLQILGTDYPTPDGTAVRDYIHVLDLAEAHMLALEGLTPGRHQIYNLGSGIGTSVREVLEAIATVTGRRPNTVDARRRAGDPPLLVASIDKITKELAWKPQRSLEQIIGDAWAYLDQQGPTTA